VQLVASSDQAKVQRLGNEVTQQWSVPTKVESVNGLFRLLVGPLQAAKAAQLLEQVKAVAYPNAYIQNKKNCG
jgi:rare lipoprotein A